MEVSSQLQDPVALPYWREHAVLIRHEAGWAPESVWVYGYSFIIIITIIIIIIITQWLSRQATTYIICSTRNSHSDGYEEHYHLGCNVVYE
jgi:hypothetical protein